MDVYNEVENDVGDAYPYNTTAKVSEHKSEELDQNVQIVCHVKKEEDANRSELIDMGVFKPTSRNATKRLRMQQKTYGTTKTTITAEAALKRIFSQEF